MNGTDYAFTLTGRTPILFHSDDVMASDELSAWRKDPKNKSVSVPGDDRSPAWTWQRYLYGDGENIVVPQENIMASLRNAAARIILKGQKTFKEISQSGLTIEGENCDFFCAGKPITLQSIIKLETKTFAEQFEAVKKLGFELKVKRAKVGTSKHVRVRAMFKSWSIKGIIGVTEAAITESVLNQMFEISGRYVGLLDWRPGCKTPGAFGMFYAKIDKC